MGFAELFDGIFSSAHIGYMKNDPRFFIMLLNELDGYQADELLFWDDIPGNVATARSVGIEAEVYQNFAQFGRDILKYITTV
jgi:putative hydrolase of the HAD superfamily